MSRTTEPWRAALADLTTERAPGVPAVDVEELVAYRRGRLGEVDAERVREALAAHASLRALYAEIPIEDPEPVVGDPEVAETIAWLREQRAAEATLAAGQAAHPPRSARDALRSGDRGASRSGDRGTSVEPRSGRWPRRWSPRAVTALAAALVVALGLGLLLGLLLGRDPQPPTAEAQVVKLFSETPGELPNDPDRGGELPTRSLALAPAETLRLEVAEPLLTGGGGTLTVSGPYREARLSLVSERHFVTAGRVTGASPSLEVGRLQPGFYFVSLEAGEAAKGKEWIEVLRSSLE